MADEIICEKKEVYIHEPPKDEVNGSLMDASKIGGRLNIFKNKHGVFLRFLPYGSESSTNEDWTFIIENSVLSYSKENKDDTENVSLDCKNNAKYKLQMNLNDLSSVRRFLPPNTSVASLVFMQNDGHTWPHLYFHKGGSKELLTELSKYLVFKKDVKDPRLYLVQRENSKAFQDSLYELSLFQEQRNDVVKKFMHQPIQSTLSSFSKVTNLFRDVLKPTDGNGAAAANKESTFYMSESASKSELMRKYGDTDTDLTNLMESMTNENIHLSNKDGFEMVTRVELGPMPTVVRGKYVDSGSISSDKEGRIQDTDKLIDKIFRGGIDHPLRIELWKYLLGYYSWNSTTKSRHDMRKIKENDYYRMKNQWMTMSEDQKSRFSLMRERENLIDKDVQRTDRTHPYFVGDDNENLTVMREILMTYNMYDFNLGYVQGMSDLLAPIMVIMDNEVDSFWCLVGYMEKIGQNFVMDQAHIKSQLADLKTLIEFVDSNFSTYLQEKDSSNMYFCFRWILILFKREFSFPDIMKLWEVLWTDKPCKNFHLLICISVLLMKKDDIMANQYGFNEILKFVNDMSLHIDLDETLKYAEGLYLQLSSFKNLPASICEIIGLPFSEKSLPRDETELADLSRIKSSCSSASNSRSNLHELSESENSAKSKPGTPSKRN